MPTPKSLGKVALCGVLFVSALNSAQAVLTSYSVTHTFVNPTGSNATNQTVLGQAVHTILGSWGSFDITVRDAAGNPGGYFDGLGIGSTDGTDYGINGDDKGPLVFTIDNYTGLLASNTGYGGTPGQTVLIESIDLGRFGSGENDEGIYSDSNGNSFTFSQGGGGGTLDTAWPSTGDVYNFGTPLTNNPAATPAVVGFPAVSASGLNVGQGGFIAIQGTKGNPRFEIERLSFTIVVPEPSRVILIVLGMLVAHSRRRRRRNA